LQLLGFFLLGVGCRRDRLLQGLAVFVLLLVATEQFLELVAPEPILIPSSLLGASVPSNSPTISAVSSDRFEF
jgi:hypothetical protein